MMILEGLYNFSIACIYCLIAGITYFSHGTVLQFTAVVACMTITGILHGYLRKYGKWSWLVLPLVYLPMLLVDDIDGIAFVLFPAFFVTVAGLRNLRPAHESFGKILYAGMFAGVFFLLISYIFDAGTPIPAFLFLFVGSGAALMRSLRLPGSEINLDFQKNNILSLMGAAGLLSIITMPAIWRGMMAVIRWIYMNIIINIVYGAAYVLASALSVVLALLTMLFKNLHLQAIIPEIDTSKIDGTYDYYREAYEYLDFKYSAQLRIIIVAVVLILIVAYVYYTVSHMQPKRPLDTGKVEYIREKVKPAERLKGNRGSIRRSYRKYLEILKTSGLVRKEGDTSRDVLEDGVLSHTVPREESEELRELYISARYDIAREPDNDQASQAKDVLKKLRQTQTE